MRKILISLLLVFFCLISALKSQDFDNLRSLNYSLDFIQIKDELNYGLVFSGIQHKFTYKRSWKINERDLIYQGEFGFATLSSKGIAGLQFKFKPIDVFYNAYERIRKISFAGGPWLKVDYNYQLYPELQSGYSFHYSNITLGISASAKYQNDVIYLRLRWKNSVAGLVSRTPAERDPYFFDLSLGSYFKDQHKNFEAGSFNLYNNTWIELLFVNQLHPRLGYAYTFEFMNYTKEPSLKAMTHGISLFFFPRT